MRKFKVRMYEGWKRQGYPTYEWLAEQIGAQRLFVSRTIQGDVKSRLSMKVIELGLELGYSEDYREYTEIIEDETP